MQIRPFQPNPLTPSPRPAARPEQASRSYAHPLRRLRLLAFVIVFPLQMATAQAKDLEPRSYSNTPVGMNFLIAGYGYAEGKMAFDPSTSITDADYRTHMEVLAYARSLNVRGKSAKIDVVLPYSSFSAQGLVDGQQRERTMSGPLDPRLRFSMNFHGAPALSLKEFASYRQDLIIGASLQVNRPGFCGGYLV
jgi:hypothetical protein